MTPGKILKSPIRSPRSRYAEAWREAECVSRGRGCLFPAVLELRIDDSFNAEAFDSIYAKEIRDVLLSSMFGGQTDTISILHGRPRPSFSPAGTGKATNESPLEAAMRKLSTFNHLLPHLAAITAKKQGRQRGREHIRLVADSDPVNLAMRGPVFGFKLVGPKRWEGDWILPGKLIPDDDDFHSSQFRGDPSRTAFHRITLGELARVARGARNPWAFMYSSRELILVRFYEIPSSPRWVKHGLDLHFGALCYPVPALPWYRDAPKRHRRALSYHLGLWVGLMARLCVDWETIPMGLPRELNTWHRHFDLRAEEEVYEARCSTAVRRTTDILSRDARSHPVVGARGEAVEWERWKRKERLEGDDGVRALDDEDL